MCSGIVVVLYETVSQLTVKPTIDLKLPILGKVVEVAIKKRICWCFESSESSISKVWLQSWKVYQGPSICDCWGHQERPLREGVLFL